MLVAMASLSDLIKNGSKRMAKNGSEPVTCTLFYWRVLFIEQVLLTKLSTRSDLEFHSSSNFCAIYIP